MQNLSHLRIGEVTGERSDRLGSALLGFVADAAHHETRWARILVTVHVAIEMEM